MLTIGAQPTALDAQALIWDGFVERMSNFFRAVDEELARNAEALRLDDLKKDLEQAVAEIRSREVGALFDEQRRRLSELLDQAQGAADQVADLLGLADQAGASGDDVTASAWAPAGSLFASKIQALVRHVRNVDLDSLLSARGAGVQEVYRRAQRGFDELVELKLRPGVDDALNAFQS